ncbi:hypothetical protein SERLA73DRAFT_192065 [Serpula lacrymans var. lacrymans S7.3]|uniref:Thioredoxin domain-containing protein n=2 Tax=Serpula lacrymans var. lacrymans TaxID=341189 RepID=F8QIX1_SERL3|nr:uncharacterized protein SERLADRAFT_473753 [Serpula lacrymans var. lacrymans S7.9]EGN91741.1 hypothetical protein SERLA73DRAFT_192065 [Serpula lacrymans var. lacrymans S7.3]EGO22659.1 hypothetical protein SERLADRAFT_473753 [Serpula lacrymans var. lacrymans S7.9]
MKLSLITFVYALLPALVSAAIFPSNTQVKMLDPKGFRKAMKENRTSVVAFVAPWCGHCQRMAPEYSKAAKSLHPLVPLYAVDCDVESNKRLCADQGVQGFPTVKLFPRGNQAPAKDYNQQERTSGRIIRWASDGVPNKVKNLPTSNDISTWAGKNSYSPRVILLNKDKKSPLLWQVLGNNYWKKLSFGHHSDPSGNTAATLGFEAEEKQSKVLVYLAGSEEPKLYDGLNKFEPLSQFFDSILDGTADYMRQESPRDEL